LREILETTWQPNETGESLEKMFRVKPEKDAKVREEDAGKNPNDNIPNSA